MGAYAQDDVPVLRQTAMEGHAVRAALLWTGVAAAAAVNGREDYRDAAERVWAGLVEPVPRGRICVSAFVAVPPSTRHVTAGIGHGLPITHPR